MIWIPLIGWVIITVGVIAYYLYDDWLNKKLTTPMDFAYEASDIFGASVLILIFVIVLFRNHKS
jgi:phosphotransferase system  glucose/maltose/N-acetylglucosamine-specific IIC component